VTVHAWFSSERALRSGSTVYRKPDESRVNVTRTNIQRDGKVPSGGEEQYLGEVIRIEDGGCVSAKRRVRGIREE
jgi:hypothetical protein